MARRQMTFDIWIGTKFSVEAASLEEAESVVLEWLRRTLSAAGDDDKRIRATSEPRNLVEAAVRVLNQSGEQRREEN